MGGAYTIQLVTTAGIHALIAVGSPNSAFISSCLVAKRDAEGKDALIKVLKEIIAVGGTFINSKSQCGFLFKDKTASYNA